MPNYTKLDYEEKDKAVSTLMSDEHKYQAVERIVEMLDEYDELWSSDEWKEAHGNEGLYEDLCLLNSILEKEIKRLFDVKKTDLTGALQSTPEIKKTTLVCENISSHKTSDIALLEEAMLDFSSKMSNSPNM